MTQHHHARGAGLDRRPAARPGAARLAAAVLVAGLLSSGCAVGEDVQDDAFSGTPRPELAGKAEVDQRNRATKPDGKRPGKGKVEARPTGRGGNTEQPPSPRAGATPDAAPEGRRTPSPPPAGQRVLLRTADPADDHGVGGPAYADLTGLEITADDSTMRLVLSVAGTVPGRLADGEVAGFGIDFFGADPQESAYQVFLDGGSDGWSAYLQTPRGFTAFPGSFVIAGGTLTVTIPRAAVSGGAASAFADWSSPLLVATGDTVERGSLS